MLKNKNTSAESQELKLFFFTNMVVSNGFFNINFYLQPSCYLNPKILLWKKNVKIKNERF
jgi:hypothetical protein